MIDGKFSDKHLQKQLLIALKQVCKEIEVLIETGMPTASDSTIKKFDQAFKQLSSMGLMRLGSNLRLLNQEIQRYVIQDNDFSARRLSFFLNRCWLMCQGLVDALNRQDNALWQSLSFSQETKHFEQLTFITLGVSKKMVSGVFAAFEFRLRIIDTTHELADKLCIFSLIFPLKKGQKVHPEAYLEFEQKQGYRPKRLLSDVFNMDKVVVSYETHQRVRINLLPDAQVTFFQPAIEQENFDALMCCDPVLAKQQLIDYQPSPFDLEIDLQTEVLLLNWQMSDLREDPGFPDRFVIDIGAAGVDYLALISKSEEGEALLLALQGLVNSDLHPPLFALMHYELGQRIIQPLSLVTDKGLTHLMLGQDKTDYKALLKQSR